MADYEELLAIITEENQQGLETWLDKEQKRRSSFRELPKIIAIAAAYNGSVFGYEQAIRYGYEISREDLIQASQKGEADVVDFLLQHVPHEQKWLTVPLNTAIYNQNLDIIDVLLQAGAIPSEENGIYAVADKNINLVHKLYIHGLIPTARMMEGAIQKRDSKMIKALLAIHPSLEFSYTGVRQAKIAKLFLETAPTREQALEMLDSHDPRSALILHLSPELIGMMFDYALEHDSQEAVNAISVINSSYWEPFSDKIATIAARTNSTRLLGMRGSFPNIKLDGYDYPVIEAVVAGSKDVLKKFLDSKFPTNVVSPMGMTPAMLAAALDNYDIVKLLSQRLIQGGAHEDTFLGPVNGHSPLSVAIAYNSLKCAELLKWRIKWVCTDDICIEMNEGQRISINMKEASPEMRQLLRKFL